MIWALLSIRTLGSGNESELADRTRAFCALGISCIFSAHNNLRGESTTWKRRWNPTNGPAMLSSRWWRSSVVWHLVQDFLPFWTPISTNVLARTRAGMVVQISAYVLHWNCWPNAILGPNADNARWHENILETVSPSIELELLESFRNHEDPQDWGLQREYQLDHFISWQVIYLKKFQKVDFLPKTPYDKPSPVQVGNQTFQLSGQDLSRPRELDYYRHDPFNIPSPVDGDTVGR